MSFASRVPWSTLSRRAVALGGIVLAASAAVLPQDVVAERTRALVRGSVILPDDGSPNGLYAYVTSRAHRDSVAITESGTFALPLAGAHCGPLELRIDAAPGTERRYHAARVRLDARGQPIGPYSRSAAGSADATMRILLVPRRYTIDGGTHSGIVVPIDIAAAFAPTWQRNRYWRIARVSSSDGYGTPVAWPESFFPIPVVLRARGGISTADSAAFWRSARQLEADFGRSLFQPAPDQPGDEEIWKLIVVVEPGVGTAGMTFITYDSFGAIYEATIAIRSRALLADERLVSHELLHALGFGHSSGWYSTAGPAPIGSARATASDVAYAQLLYRLRRAHIDQGVSHGLLASSLETPLAVSAPASQCAR